jgi:hypothetical protein
MKKAYKIRRLKSSGKHRNPKSANKVLGVTSVNTFVDKKQNREKDLEMIQNSRK